MKQLTISCMALLLVAMTVLLPLSALADGMPELVIDGHLHYLDFLQQSDGLE